MGIFGFGRSYTEEDLQNEINKLEKLHIQAMSNRSASMKREFANQYDNVINICKKGNFSGMETVKWCGGFTSLRNVTSMVQVAIELM